MADFLGTILGFVISLIVSTLIIYFVARLFGETESIGTAVIAALIGSVIYAVAYYFLGGGLLAAAIAGIAWLIALGTLYKIGWLKSFVIALIVWIFASLVSFILPTLTGPL
jgi:hypothetical protein